MTPRKLVFDLLQKLEKNQQFSNIILDNALRSEDMSDADKGLATALFYGVTEKRLTLDHQISKLSSRPIKELDGGVLTALRMGLYQLIFMDRIPPHAAINETVELCPKKSRGFVNAILRSFTRTPTVSYPSAEENEADYVSVRYSVCSELAKKFIDIFGLGKTESILRGFEKENKTVISVNTVKISRDELASHIKGAELTEYSPKGLRLGGAVRDIYGYSKGLFFVQDEASQICVEALDARAGQTVLDICACPGSKSFGAAISMKNEGVIKAFDLHAKKLPLITEGAKRLGIDIISVSERDGRDLSEELLEAADRVICDVPCSGFGVLSKKPELRYKDPKASENLPSIQAAILNNACRYVKRGGILVYSTCTVFPEENERNVESFLEAHPDFSLSPFSVGGLDVSGGYITLLPDEYPTDGFFIARMVRK